MRVNVRRALAIAATLACAWALPAMAADFKIPPTPDHFVTDNAGALSSGARDSIENELHAYESATGHQVVVWIGQTTGDVPLETWTGEAADHWKIGRKGKDDGAVLFLFMKDHMARIEVGYGLESSLTDAASFRIITDIIRPKMRANDVDGAVSSGVAAMLTTITPSYTGVTPPPDETSTTSLSGRQGIEIAAFVLISFGFLIFIVIMQIVAGIRYGYLVMREGSVRAKADMKHSWLGGGILLGGSSFGGGGGGFGGGGFSGGGGGFGGGGASGGW
jgi:uncharacterized protein